ncbi:SUF system NifU family Fe-S cluster assembly protein [Arthrobacter bambusae]|jgi:nitrogen fixation protein NifU and related proteins|uniref:Fe-S cluster assembly sulfur transfer protein SufU n=1 Tax=Arthrobacter TaxID=1663 RepID=UPI001F50AAD7|nr:MULTISPECIES: SUF system NifU family Fe-S cluster assembly protein [Arthrobacter]MCI0141204.1 SUF system NifU family Fe-S cluster assembly protein [Arthrobacter bambusae]UYY82630.1 SUF system NifU family Fe-S cluster assembly protein [Arthrobacter sp. YA7-1]
MSGLDSLYQQLILEHSKARSGGDLAKLPAAADAGRGDAGQAGTGQSHQLNPVCGDEITLRLSLGADGDGQTVTEIHWDGDGCAISMASASILSEMAPGMSPVSLRHTIDHFRELMRSRGKLEADEELLQDAAALAGVAKYPARVKCAMLAWVAAEDALRQAEASQGVSRPL